MQKKRKLAKTRTSRRKKLPLKSEVPLQNCFTTLQTEEERPITSGGMLDLSKAARSAPLITTSTAKEKQQVIVAGGSLLRGTEATFPSREVCCLLGACIMVVTERLPSFIQSTDHYPLLFFHMDTSDTVGRSLRSIKEDYKALGAVVRTVIV